MALLWRPSKLAPDHASFLPKSTPLEGLPALVDRVAAVDWQIWQQFWLDRGAVDLGAESWAQGTDPNWLWCLGLPMLSQAERAIQAGERRLIGLNALPGCGKTTLGHWLESAAGSLGFALKVISIDDFYLPAEAMDRAMAGNPWGVPRALPGSHDIALMQRSLSAWKQGESVLMPRFDKALREGRGDRSGEFLCDADVLILEGWFLGCRPMASSEPLASGSDHLMEPLRPEELSYRRQIQEQLAYYIDVWDEVDCLWQLAATDFNAPQQWKRQQEAAMKRNRGSGLDAAAIDDFIRMIQTAIPATSFTLNQASVVIDIDPDRRLRQIRVRP